MKNFIARLVNYQKKGKVLFWLVLLLVIIVTTWGPGGIPMRCIDVQRDMPILDNPGILPSGATSGSPHFSYTHSSGTDCYSPFNSEFWKPTEGEIMFQSISHLMQMAIGGIDKSTIIHPSYAADYSDNLILMGASHNVFVGKVIKQIGTGNLAGSPTTQYAIEVTSNIKGSLVGVVIVTQLAGYRDGVFYLTDEDSKLLQSNSTYLFATRYNSEDNTYTLNSHPNASKMISSDATLDVESLKSLADKDIKVKALEAAYPKEKLLDADIYHNNTRNDFQSLPVAEKTAARSRADEAKVSLEAASKDAQ